MWYLSLTGGGTSEKHWTNQWMDIPSSETRRKMDNVYLVDLDTDGGFDIATTEENGGWGIIWFENPVVILQNDGFCGFIFAYELNLVTSFL